MSGPIARTWAAALVVVAGAVTMRANGDTFYVNGTCGDDAWSGTSSVCSAPDGPKRTIQAGIDASVNGDTVMVADGTYMGVGNKNLDYGGRLITLRSENGPAACIIDCENDGRGVYFHDGETADAMLVGLTIRNGRLTGSDFGAAILCESASPTILNCVLANNQSREGGALYCLRANPAISTCTFVDNTGEHGGGMYNAFDCNPTLTKCTFTNNSVEFLGGGMYNQLSTPTVTNCTFSGNSAGVSGGGMWNSMAGATVTNCAFDANSAPNGAGMYSTISSPIVTNCTFSGNSAGFGAGMYNRNSSPSVTNCTFSGNSADSGSGTYNIRNASRPMVTNSIFWNDDADEIVDVDGALTTVRFSDVQGGWPDQGNINLDPLFVNPGRDDHLAPGSPCIDAADNTAVPAGITTDLDGNPRFVDDPATPDTGVGTPPIVDMGAYEFQGRCEPCDMNCDGAVDALDIEFFIDILFNGATPCDPCTGDVNGDGSINAGDIEGFINCLFP